MKAETAQSGDSCIAALLTQARQHLSHIDECRLDAEYLLAHATGETRAWLHTWPEKTIDRDTIELFDELVRNRAIGMPLAYLTGQREFWSMPLHVSRDTLIPRPETELLVEISLQCAMDAMVIVELGTGSGAVALALLGELPDKTVIATDLSAGALTVARHNALTLNRKLQLMQSDWLTAFSRDCADLIVSNPPYVVSGDPHLSGDGVLFEPAVALLGGPDGLDAYRQIVPQAAGCLRSSGTLILEHGYDQAAAVRELMSEAGFAGVRSCADAAGLDRVSVASLP